MNYLESLNKIYNVGIYIRLSREDERLGESGSISTQRDLLLNYIRDNNLISLTSVLSLQAFIILDHLNKTAKLQIAINIIATASITSPTKNDAKAANNNKITIGSLNSLKNTFTLSSITSYKSL